MSGSLAAYTTFGIGGRARELFETSERQELIELAGNGALVIGGGSNVLVSDNGYDGTVVINRYCDLNVKDTVVAGSGLRLPSLCRRLAQEGLSGLEWAVGIPGTVGGAVRMNAGAFGKCIADSLLYADVLRGGRVVRMTKDELGFSYRMSALNPTDVVIDCAFELSSGSALDIERRMNEFSKARRARQPSERSAGSVFKNPKGLHIARLIESAGLKGYSVGGAMVSRVHANIIVNTGYASAKDVVAVIKRVKDELLFRYGVRAEEEIIYIGDFD